MNPLIQQLQNIGNGQHVHTINKSIYYLEKFDKDPEKYKVHKENLESLIRSALHDSQWRRVGDYMASWW